MLWVNGYTVIVAFATSADVLPAAFLFLEIEAGSVREEEEGDEHATQTEPWYDVELLARGDVVVHDGCE